MFFVQNHDYVILEGARRKEQRWDPHENEQIVPEGTTPNDLINVISIIWHILFLYRKWSYY